MATRDYSSRRMAIVQALENKLKGINGNSPYRTNLYNNVLPRLKFWDEVALEKLFEDIETVIEDNASLEYTDLDGNTQRVQQITILSLDTDEGALEPLAVGEIICEVRY